MCNEMQDITYPPSGAAFWEQGRYSSKDRTTDGNSDLPLHTLTTIASCTRKKGSLDRKRPGTSLHAYRGCCCRFKRPAPAAKSSDFRKAHARAAPKAPVRSVVTSHEQAVFHARHHLSPTHSHGTRRGTGTQLCGLTHRPSPHVVTRLRTGHSSHPLPFATPCTKHPSTPHSSTPHARHLCPSHTPHTPSYPAPSSTFLTPASPPQTPPPPPAPHPPAPHWAPAPARCWPCRRPCRPAAPAPPPPTRWP